MKPNQKIPYGSGEAELVEKKSRFISHVYHIQSAEEANEILQDTRKKYWDANHNCYAYILDSDNVMRFSDDGEPQGTAGMPILEVLKKQHIYCALIIVTRYFGGTLLGAGGLTRAYGKAATMALDDSGVSILTPYCEVSVQIGYSFLETVRNSYDRYEAVEKDVEYGADVILKLEMPQENYEVFNKYMIEMSSALAVPKIIGERLLPKKI